MSKLKRVLRDIFKSAHSSLASPVATRLGLQRSALVAPIPRVDEWTVLQRPEGAAAGRLLREEAEAKHAFFASSGKFQEQLQAEAAYLLAPEEEAPDTGEAHGPWHYYQAVGTQGLLFCRRPVLGGKEEVILDMGAFACETGMRAADLIACKVSDDHSLIAYIVDAVGDESYELRLSSLGVGGGAWAVKLSGIRSVEFVGGGGDAQSGVGLLVVHTDPHTKRACRVSYIRVGPQGVLSERDQVVWEEDDEESYLEVIRTKDRRFVMLSSNTKDKSEMRVVPCAAMDSPAPLSVSAQVLLTRREGVEYFAEHNGNDFYIMSNHERPDFAVYRMPEKLLLDSSSNGWPHLDAYFIPPGNLHVTDADMLDQWLVLYGHESAEPRVCVVPLNASCEESRTTSKDATVRMGDGVLDAYLAPLPSPVGSVEPGVNANPSSQCVRFNFRSPVEAGASLDLDLASRHVQIVSRRKWSTSSGIIPEMFSCERISYPARDGKQVPMTLVRFRGPSGDGHWGPAPCLLHVYGAYGTCTAPDFRPENIALLRRGWALAWAHVRGGGEQGRAWHAAGRKLEKAQSVKDLADAISFLIARAVAAPGYVCLRTASAGGIAVGALLNSPNQAQRVGAAILEVPFVDVLTGMSDPSLPLTIHEFAEWGDPRDPIHEANLRSLSPYENVGSHSYPPMYLSCALADARVPPWMPLKLAARIRARSPGYLTGPLGGGTRRKSRSNDLSNTAPNIVLHCSDGGHGGAADWESHSEQSSSQIAFLHKALGLPFE